MNSDILKHFDMELLCENKKPDRLNPVDARIYTRSDDGIYEKLEPCICDSQNTKEI